MPWYQKPMKDVVACDKPRGAGKQALIRGLPNGETHPDSSGYPAFIVGREPRELKHLSNARKREYSLSSGERKGISPNLIFGWGVAGLC